MRFHRSATPYGMPSHFRTGALSPWVFFPVTALDTADRGAVSTKPSTVQPVSSSTCSSSLFMLLARLIGFLEWLQDDKVSASDRRVPFYFGALGAVYTVAHVLLFRAPAQ